MQSEELNLKSRHSSTDLQAALNEPSYGERKAPEIFQGLTTGSLPPLQNRPGPFVQAKRPPQRKIPWPEPGSLGLFDWDDTLGRMERPGSYYLEKADLTSDCIKPVEGAARILKLFTTDNRQASLVTRSIGKPSEKLDGEIEIDIKQKKAGLEGFIQNQYIHTKDRPNFENFEEIKSQAGDYNNFRYGKLVLWAAAIKKHRPQGGSVYIFEDSANELENIKSSLNPCLEKLGRNPLMYKIYTVGLRQKAEDESKPIHVLEWDSQGSKEHFIDPKSEEGKKHFSESRKIKEENDVKLDQISDMSVENYNELFDIGLSETSLL